MCGIAGFVDFDRKTGDASLLKAMTDAIRHRGPDDEGYALIDREGSEPEVFSGKDSPADVRNIFHELKPGQSVRPFDVALGHRRFSIIDLSSGGHQPFFDRERTCCLVFNGEIYNYLELRQELERDGAVFKTQSDTEVLLESYKRYGTGCFEKFNGFWAIALYDFKKKRLLLSRDRIGKKPLYWTRAGSRVYFASEIKALLEVPEVRARKRPNERSICYWLVFGQKDLDDDTCFEGIYCLPAASWVFMDPGFPANIQTFWRVPEKRLGENEISVGEAARKLREILFDAVRIRLRADVPLSVELSGGLDSSAIMAVASRLHSKKITTYTVRFPEKEWDEEPFARSVARRYDADYRVIDSPLENFWRQSLPFTYLQEEPYHSPNLQTTQVISSRMRSMGTKISLSGAAGDENFAGYAAYFYLSQMDALARGKIGRFMANATNYSEANTKIKTTLQPLALLLTGKGRKMMPEARFADENGAPYFKGRRYVYPCGIGSLSEALRSDMTRTLMPYWMRSDDRNYMGIPIEVRTPFLDYRMVEFAFKLPASYLIRGGWHKWILRNSLRDLLPPDVLWRKRKMGFPFPFKRFFSENAGIIGEIFRRSNNPFLDMRDGSLRSNWKAVSFVLWYEFFFNDNTNLFKVISSMSERIHSPADYGFEPEFLRSVGNKKLCP